MTRSLPFLELRPRRDASNGNATSPASRGQRDGEQHDDEEDIHILQDLEGHTSAGTSTASMAAASDMLSARNAADKSVQRDAKFEAYSAAMHAWIERSLVTLRQSIRGLRVQPLVDMVETGVVPVAGAADGTRVVLASIQDLSAWMGSPG